MGNQILYLSFLFLILFICFACEDKKIEKPKESDKSVSSDSNRVNLEFSFDINKEIYQKTNFGDPPQIAIWIKSPDSNKTKTVWVTYRAGKNDWKGKIECPVALPFWEAETGLASRIFDSLDERKSEFDAVTGATPMKGRFSAGIKVSRYSSWEYFVEVNVSADYNQSFPYWSKEGLPDSEANGQPSLVYTGRITADGNSRDIPILIGRTEQRNVVDTLSSDLSGIMTAKHLIGNIQVRSRFKFF
jgi:hypothetical protein